MQQDWIAKRVELLELSMNELKELPAVVAGLDQRVAALEGQFLQHRAEMRGEFSAVRAEMRAMNEETRIEMRAMNEETKALMRVLHEEVLDRIKKLGEGSGPSPITRRRR